MPKKLAQKHNRLIIARDTKNITRTITRIGIIP